MSLTSADASNYRRAVDALSPTLSSANTILLSGWVKLTAAGADTVRGLWSLGGNAVSLQQINLNVGSGNALTYSHTSNTTTTTYTLGASIAAHWDAWVNIAAIVEGPHDGSSQAFEIYVAGSLYHSGTFTSQNTSQTIDTLYVGRSFSNGNRTDSKSAYLAAGSYATFAAAQTAAGQCATTDPASISGIVHAYPLLNDGAASVGGPTLSVVGTGGSFDADMPTFGGGGGGSIITSVCFMHRETPQQQARRLGLSGRCLA